MVYYLWFTIYGLLSMVYYLWFTIYGLLSMVYYLWFTIYGLLSKRRVAKWSKAVDCKSIRLNLTLVQIQSLLYAYL